MKRPLILLLLALLWTVPALAVDHLLPAVEWGSQGVKVRLSLIDQDTPDTCPSTDITTSTTGLTLRLSTDVTDGYYETYTPTGYSGSTTQFEAITTIGVWQAGSDTSPGPSKIPFEVISASATPRSCLYELHLPNQIMDEVDGSGNPAKVVYIELGDSAGEIVTDTWQLPLSGVTAETLSDHLLSTDCSTYDTPDTVGLRLCNDDFEEIHTAVTETLDDKLDTIDANVDGIAPLLEGITDRVLWEGLVDTATSQTELVVTNPPTYADQYVTRMLCVADVSSTPDKECREITDYDQATDTFTIASALPFTVEAGDSLWIAASDARIATVLADTNDIQTRVPAALVSGRMDSSVGAMASNVVTAAAAASDLTTELQSGLATASALSTVDGIVDDIVADTVDIQSRLPTSLVSGRIDASVGAMAANTMTAAAAASDLTTELQSGLATASALSTIGTNVDQIETAVVSTLPGLVNDVAEDAAAAVFDTLIDGQSFECWLATNGAVISGRSSIIGNTYTYKRENNAANRLAMTVNGSNERTAISRTCP